MRTRLYEKLKSLAKCATTIKYGELGVFLGLDMNISDGGDLGWKTDIERVGYSGEEGQIT